MRYDRSRDQRHPGAPARSTRAELIDLVTPGARCEEGRRDASISIALVDQATIHALNRAAPRPRLAHRRDQLPALGSRRADPGRRAGRLRRDGRRRRPRRTAWTRGPNWRCTWSTACLHLCGYDDPTESGRRGDATPRGRDPDRSLRIRPTPGESGRRPHERGSSERCGGLPVIGWNVAGILAVGLPVLALHLVRDRLDQGAPIVFAEPAGGASAGRGAARSVPRRWPISISGPSGAAETLAVLTGLLLAALVGMGVCQLGSATSGRSGCSAGAGDRAAGLCPGGGHRQGLRRDDHRRDLAGLGRRPRRWRSPLTFGLRQVEWLVEWAAGRSESPHRPASVEVEIPTEEEVSEDDEPELPESGPRAAPAGRRADPDATSPRS